MSPTALQLNDTTTWTEGEKKRSKLSNFGKQHLHWILHGEKGQNELHINAVFGPGKCFSHGAGNSETATHYSER